MRVEFSTREYEMNHGAKPRGRGNWAFVDQRFARSADYLARVYWAGSDLLLSEAKKKAAEHFKAVPGFSGVVEVCS
jgi:hypothetical protein